MLWILKNALGEDAFSSTDPVQLCEGAISTDISEFRDALRDGRVQDAHTLRRGPFLHDFGVAAAAPWDDWVDGIRDDLDARFVGALETLAHRRLEEGRFSEAAEVAEDALAVHPHRLVLHRVAIEAMLGCGDTSAALDGLFQAERQVGDIPGAAVILRELRDRAEQRLFAEGLQREDGYGFHVDFVGRTRDLARLNTVAAAAREHAVQVVLITGPPGIGKTRLATEILQASAGAGAQVSRIRCHRAEKGLAWGCAADLISELLQLEGASGVNQATDAVLAAIVPTSARATTNGSYQSNGHPERQEPAAYADALLDLVQAVAFEGPVAILIDDAQWIDEESRMLLARVMRKLGDESVLILVTSRNPIGTEGMLPESAHSVELGPLTADEVSELVQLAVAIKPEGSSERVTGKIAEASAGNPLFVSEILRRLVDDGVVEDIDDAWTLDAEQPPDPISLPESVRDLIGERIAKLPADSRALSETLASRPGAHSPERLREAAGMDSTRFVRAFSDLIARGILEWVGPRIDFAHEHLRDAAAAGTGRTGPARARGRRGFLWLAGAAAVVAAIAVFTTPGGPASGPTYPYGRGVLAVMIDGQPVAFRPPTKWAENGRGNRS